MVNAQVYGEQMSPVEIDKQIAKDYKLRKMTKAI